MEKKYQIFISSTYKDLKAARLKVRDVILSMYHFPVGMEMFGSLDEDQWEVIKRDIDESDYYILIVGKCFGSEVPGEGISYTQKEFRYAVSKGIPVLAFLIKENASVPKTFKETDPVKNQKLAGFRKEVESGRTVSYWSDVNELATEVSISLSRQIARKPGKGWLRATEFDVEKSHAELLSLIDRVKELESENAELIKEHKRKAVPKIVVEPFEPIRFNLEHVDPPPNALVEAAERGEKYKADILGFGPYYEDASKLLENFRKRSTILSGYAWLDLLIKNEGTGKATDLTVEIDAPDGLQLYESIDMGMLTNLDVPGKYFDDHRKGTVHLGGLSSDREDYPKGFLTYERMNGWDSPDNSSARIFFDDLRHHDAKTCFEFFVTATKPGTYKLRCNIMCAEFEEPQFQELTVTVKELN